MIKKSFLFLAILAWLVGCVANGGESVEGDAAGGSVNNKFSFNFNGNQPQQFQAQYGNACYTSYGACQMYASGPIGGSCGCPTPYGYVGGQIR